MSVDLRIFVQARMSSSRFPGKMLAPFNGQPLVRQVFRSLETLKARCVLLTSTDATDDPLADYVEKRCGVQVYRGALDNVVQRFQGCIKAYPCEWFVRISGDSPLIDSALVHTVFAHRSDNIDLVSNVARRTFPNGQSVECLKSDTFLALASETLTSQQQEHVTKVYYDHPSKFRIRSVVSRDPTWSTNRMVVDTMDDLRRLEAGVAKPASSFADLAELDVTQGAV